MMIPDTAAAWFIRTCVFPLVDREGPSRPRLFRDLLRTQWLTPEEVARSQRTRLAMLLSHAIATVPYYRDTYRCLRAPVASEDLRTVLDRLPILTKKEIQSHGKALRSTAVPAEHVRTAKTGGSTGTSLTVHFDIDCEAHRVAAAWRSDGWASWQLGDLRGAVWGSPSLPGTRREHVRAWLYDRTFYLDTMHLSPEAMAAFYATYQRRKPRVLFGHSHSLYILARYLEGSGLRPTPPAGIISTSMMLMQPERETIERVFTAKVFNRYGCEEVGLIAAECDRHQGLHVNAEHVIVEILDDRGKAVLPGVSGRVVVTDLINRAMPLIRYEVGDLAVWGKAKCPCGRALPLISHLVGRTADFLIRVDGGLVAGVSLIEKTLTALPGLLQMQLEQNELRTIDVRVVTNADFDQGTETRLRQELFAAFGPDTTFRVQRVEAIVPTGRGKYRFSICNIQAPRSGLND